MSAGSKARRTRRHRARPSRAVQKRGLQIFALAFVFRFQSFVLSNAPAWTMLKVDILNIMGPSIILAATLWGARSRTARARIIALRGGDAGLRLDDAGHPAVAGAGAPCRIRSRATCGRFPDLTNFTFFPWMAFVMAGALIGVILDAARSPEADRRVNLGFGVAGLVLALRRLQGVLSATPRRPRRASGRPRPASFSSGWG